MFNHGGGIKGAGQSWHLRRVAATCLKRAGKGLFQSTSNCSVKFVNRLLFVVVFQIVRVASRRYPQVSQTVFYSTSAVPR